MAEPLPGKLVTVAYLEEEGQGSGEVGVVRTQSEAPASVSTLFQTPRCLASPPLFLSKQQRLTLWKVFAMPSSKPLSAGASK